MDKLTPAQRRKNMQHVKNKDSQIELKLRRALWHAGFRYRKNYRAVFGCPDIVFLRMKIAVFCDSEFWHGYDWENRKHDLKSHQEFWIPKIERNMARDREVNERLQAEGWTVLRFFGREIKNNIDECVKIIAATIAAKKDELQCRRTK
ncbi:MAG: DNA mismatch endonuclease Vsr [Selenomonadaceae bacterium]|nr:DNA mismatch endonuclease Vsr [Selenomonadaceae bacterium]